MNFTYDEIHDTVVRLGKAARKFDPDVIVAVGTGGFIPARILKSVLAIPIIAVNVSSYADKTAHNIVCHQWFDPNSKLGSMVNGGRVLIVDDVDDTSRTLAFVVDELWKTSTPAEVGVAVIHNKLKPKEANLCVSEYFCGDDVDDVWVTYPWDQRIDDDNTTWSGWPSWLSVAIAVVVVLQCIV